MNYHSQVLFIFWFFIVHTAIFVYVMVAHIFKRSLFVVHSKSLSLFRVFEREKVNYGNLFRQNIKRAPFKPWNIHTHTLYPAIESLWKFTSFIFLNEICLVDLLWTDDRIEHAAIVLNLEYVSTILFYFHHTFGIFFSSSSLHSFAPITRSLCKLK